MARGNEIVLSSDPRGRFLEGVIDDTSLPGTIMEIVPGSAVDGSGRHHWRASSLAQGRPRLIAVLLPDSLQGFLMTAAYVAGKRCFLYCPLPGDELNVLVDIPGTGTGASGGGTVGELLEANPDGRLTLEVSTTAPCPFVCLEKIADVAATFSQLTWCMYTGG